MCGLYSFKTSAAETRGLFQYMEAPEFPPRAYVTPGSPIAIVRGDRGQRHFALARWGFVPAWQKEIKPGKPLINARGETVAEKPSFRNAMKRRRCLVPADGYYEWSGDVPGQKQAYYIHRPDHGLFGLAGIWEHWMGADGSELETAALITTEPNAKLRAIHDRMPAVIEPHEFNRWLDTENVSPLAASSMLKAMPEDYFDFEPTVVERKAPPPKPPRQTSLF